MREINFRGKRIDSGEWIYGHFFKTDAGSFIGEYNDEVQVVPESVGQFIGAKDKNLIDVFEGDIMRASLGTRMYGKTNKTKTFNMPVRWNNCMLCFDLAYPENYGSFRFMNGGFDDKEVIGNIHENPELLK